MQTGHSEQFRPIAYVALQDADARTRVASLLERAGWTVLHQPTGFHVLQAISGLIEGDHSWLRPGLIVIDAFSRGCAGTSIAAGLRDLGIAIPIVVVAAPGGGCRFTRRIACCASRSSATSNASYASSPHALVHAEQPPCNPTSTSRMSSHAA